MSPTPPNQPPETPPQTGTPPPAPAEAQKQEAAEAIKGSSREQFQALKGQIDPIVYFTQRVTEEGSDFAGSDENLETNTVFTHIKNELQSFIETELKDKENAPADIKAAWETACVEFLVAEIEEYEKDWGRMKINDARDLVEALKDPQKTAKESGAHGIGKFKDWVQSNPVYKQRYDAYEKTLADQAEAQDKAKREQTKAQEEEKEAKEKQATSLNEQKEKFFNGVNDAPPLETRLGALSLIAPAALSTQLQDLKKAVQDSDGSNMPALEKKRGELEKSVAALEELDKLAKDPEVTLEIPEADRKRILEEVKNGAKTPEKAKEELTNLFEAKKAAGETADAESHGGDGFISMLEGWGLGGVAKSIVDIAVKLAHVAIIGSWIRGLFSNKLLAEHGDEQAKLAIAIEQEFRRFGLPASLVDQLGEKDTKDVIALIRKKPADITADPIQQKQLALLATQLEAKGGAGSSTNLVSFMTDAPPGWQYKEGGPAPAQTPPAQTPTAPDQKAPENAPAQTETQKVYAQKLNELLQQNQGTKNLKNSALELKNLPYVEGSEIKYVDCEFRSNSLRIGDGRTFNIKLPHEAKFTTINISGSLETGNLTLRAEATLGSKDVEIPTKEFIGYFETLRTMTDTKHTFGEITFERIDNTTPIA